MTKIEEAFLDLSLVSKKILTSLQNLNINQGGGHPAFAQNSSHAHAVDLLDCISEFFKTDTLDE
jgi:hypothetical protein